MDAVSLVKRQQLHFATGSTISLQRRLEILSRLHAAIRSSQHQLITALKKDLGKSAIDAYSTEIGYALSEVEYASKHVRSWVQKTRVKTLFVNQPGKSWYQARPFGCALIISPWNYPFALTFAPLAAAVAAGNCVIIKPSEYAAATESCITAMIEKTFDNQEIAVVTGGPDQTQELVSSGVDIIFFTGGTETGKKIMRTAAQTLTPVVLELGGKNPCIVDRTAPIPETARRIVWGKFLNAGQTCMAPDYICVHEDVAEALQQSLICAIRKFYGEAPLESSAYGRIINAQHFSRITALLKEHKTIVHGGMVLPDERYIAPTLIHVDNWDTPLMQEEIFGPVLPIITYHNSDQLISKLRTCPSPLAWYCFTTDKRLKRTIEQRAKCGTICFNGTIHALLTHELPFGGIGLSGMGRYHGRAGFDAFSYTCGVLDKHSRREFTALYPPYTASVSFLSKVRRFLM